MSPQVWLKFSMVSAAAFVVVFGLFAMMHALVASDLANIADPPEPIRFDFVAEQRELTANQRKLPEKVAKPEKPKTPENQAEPESLNLESVDFAYAAPGLDLVRGDLSQGWASTRDPLPVMRVTPVYPSRASRRGIEGWTEVEFTITAIGSTEDIRVVAEEPPGIFGQAAVKAVRRWKYKPQTIDGEMKPRPGVRVVLKFELEK